MRLCRVVSLLLVLAAQIAAVVILHRLGAERPGWVDWGDLSAWLSDSRPEDVVVAAVRVAGLVVAWWLLAGSALYILASATRLPALVRSVEWATLPAVRRIVDGAVATIVASSTLGAGVVTAGATTEPAHGLVVVLGQQDRGEAAVVAYRPRPAGDDIGQDQPSYRPRAAGDHAAGAVPASPVAPAPPRPAASTLAPSTSSSSSSSTVQRRDNLWRIAERQLAAGTGRLAEQLRDDEVRAYWQRLVLANRSHLISGDANLIYPGEQLHLPEVLGDS